MFAILPQSSDSQIGSLLLAEVLDECGFGSPQTAAGSDDWRSWW
jgi:hypothetical protein